MLHDRRSSVSRSRRKRDSYTRNCPMSLQALEKREFLSADVVLQWNQAVLSAIRTDKPTVGFATRDVAIVHTAIYDAVNAIDDTSSVFRVKAMEDALSKNWSPEALKGVTVSSEGLMSDLHASAEYRAHLVMVMAQRAVAAAK